MAPLVLGLVLFLGIHSVRIVADPWRTDLIARRGERAWRLGYTLVSILGLALVVWGYTLARVAPWPLWTPWAGGRQLALPLTLLAFVLVVAAYVPRNHFKLWLKHPMLAGTLAWSLAHLLANHTLADLLLFGGFALWSAACFVSARRRDGLAGRILPPATLVPTLLTLLAGGLAWAAFGRWGHEAWLGVRPWP